MWFCRENIIAPLSLFQVTSMLAYLLTESSDKMDAMLDALRLSMAVTWPVAMVLTPAAMACYNQVLHFNYKI